MIESYRITPYHNTPYVGTHYSLDKKVNGEWKVVRLFLDEAEAEAFCTKLLTGSSLAV